MTHRFPSLQAALRWRKRHPRQLIKGVTIQATMPPKSLGAQVLKLAGSQLGTKESPANSNNVKYNTWYYGHAVSGAEYPWCAVFVSWVLSHCARPFHEASVPEILTKAKAKQEGLSIIAWTNVKAALAVGHVVLACYDWPGESKGVPDHVGFVHDVVDATNFHALEGNTAPSSAGSQSNGGEVCLKLRPKLDVEAFVLVKPVPG